MASKKKPTKKRAATKKSAAKPAKKTTAKKTASPKKGMAKKSSAGAGPARRADFGQPIEGFFAKHTGEIRKILDTLRELVDKAAPDATASLKWGMPFYTVDGEMMCALAAHKAHVNLILSGPPGTFADPDGLLTGEGKTGRHLKLEKVSDVPAKAVRGWLRTAATRARASAK